MNENVKAGFVGGFIAGCILVSILARAVLNHENSLSREDGRLIGLCEAKGGRMVDGVCGKFEVMK